MARYWATGDQSRTAVIASDVLGGGPALRRPARRLTNELPRIAPTWRPPAPRHRSPNGERSADRTEATVAPTTSRAWRQTCWHLGTVAICRWATPQSGATGTTT